MPLSDKRSHLNSDEHENKTNKYFRKIVVNTYLMKQHHSKVKLSSRKPSTKNSEIPSSPNMTVKTKTYNKYETNPIEDQDIEQQSMKILFLKTFPRFKCTVS